MEDGLAGEGRSKFRGKRERLCDSPERASFYPFYFLLFSTELHPPDAIFKYG